MKKVFDIFIVLVAIIIVLSGSIIALKLCVAMILVLCIVYGSKEPSLLNPYYLFSVTPLSLLLYVNVSGNYMLDLSARTYGIAVINMLAFIMALRYTKDYKALRYCTGPSDHYLVLHSCIFLTLSLFSSLFEFWAGRPFFLASVLKLCSVPALLCAIKSKNKILTLTVIALLVGISLGLLSKSVVLTIILALLFGIEKFFVKSKRGRKILAYFSGIGIVLMVFAFSFANKDRGVQDSSEVVERYERYGHVEWDSSDLLFMPYMYLTTPWANLQYLMETQDDRTYGLWLIRPVVGYMQLDDKLKDTYRMQAYSSFNTLTFVSCNFKDFGFWFSIITSILLGIFVWKIYSRYLVSNSPLDVACYVYVGLAVLEMFFSNEFLTQSFPFTIVIIMLIYKRVFFPKREPQLVVKE